MDSQCLIKLQASRGRNKQQIGSGCAFQFLTRFYQEMHKSSTNYGASKRTLRMLWKEETNFMWQGMSIFPTLRATRYKILLGAGRNMFSLHCLRGQYWVFNKQT